MDAFLISTAIIFIAELGDKSQLMAMTFAARYRAWTILASITAATALVHLFSVIVGAAIGAALPTDAISIAAGIAFLTFAAWTLRGDELTEADAARAARLPDRCSSLSLWRSSLLNSATRPCWRRSRSRPTTG